MKPIPSLKLPVGKGPQVTEIVPSEDLRSVHLSEPLRSHRESRTRDNRLDLIRGYAMLAIAINHVALLITPLGFTQENVPTLTSFGYSSAAELFFALSGYMLGLVYLRRPGSTRAILKRARLLYVVNTVVFLTGLLIAYWVPSHVRSAIEYSGVVERPLTGFLLFFTMLEQPALLDVLQMYVVLMVIAPVAAYTMRRRPAVAVLVSLGLYAASQLLAAFPSFALSLGATKEGMRDSMWPTLMAMQLLFFGSMYAGTMALHQKVFAWVSASASRRWAIVAIYAVVVVVKLGDKLGYWPTPPMVDKPSLGPLRLMHFVLTLLLLSSVIVALRKRLSHPLGRLVELVGRQTLYGFAASIPATYLAAGFWAASGGTYLAYLLSCAFVVAVVIGVAHLAELRKGGKADAFPSPQHVPRSIGTPRSRIDAEPLEGRPGGR